MKVLLINSVCGTGSTGRICTDLAKQFESEGYEVKIAYGRQTAPERFEKYAVRIGNDMDVKLHGLRTRLLDEHGFGSTRATRKFLQWADTYDPDLLWLHNLHGYYINVELLFDWIKSRPDMQVKWTLHDCWAFTGHCSHFTLAACEQWKKKCEHCKQLRRYPSSIKDNCARNFVRKRTAFTGVDNMLLIAPSKWLAELVRKSFLAEYPVEVRYNTIDEDVFKPTPSDFRKQYGLEKKKIILGVASVWDERKGYNDFLKLGQMLDEQYTIVLVGLSEKQIRKLPVKIIGIKKTNSPQELAAIYSAADVFFNPTYEDNYPTVNLEAQACGTRVITYDTGGCRETLQDNSSHLIAPGDLDGALKELLM